MTNHLSCSTVLYLRLINHLSLDTYLLNIDMEQRHILYCECNECECIEPHCRAHLTHFVDFMKV